MFGKNISNFLAESVLWDLYGKGIARKESVQISMKHKTKLKEFAKGAAEYTD